MAAQSRLDIRWVRAEHALSQLRLISWRELRADTLCAPCASAWGRELRWCWKERKCHRKISPHHKSSCNLITGLRGRFEFHGSRKSCRQVQPKHRARAQESRTLLRSEEHTSELQS